MERRPQRRPALRHGVAAIIAAGLSGGISAAATFNQTDTKTTSNAEYSGPPAAGVQTLVSCGPQRQLSRNVVCSSLGNILLSFDRVPKLRSELNTDERPQQISLGQALLKSQLNSDKVTSEATASTTTTTTAVAPVIRTAPAPITPTETTTTSTPVAEQPSPESGNSAVQAWLLKLRTCESGGNYQDNTGNGYYGAYQFSERTWSHWNTVYAYAYEAPPSVQDAAIIENTNASVGGLATQNPGCYSKGGLSQFPPSS